jgi:serine/threonine protein kinase
MTPSQYRKLAAMFYVARKIPIPKRESFARKVCEGDPQLLAHLLALIRAAEQPSDSFDRPLARFDGQSLGPRSSLGPASSIGPALIDRFRIVRELGRGGMGKVYEAIDCKTNSVVAIKLIRTRGAFAEHQRIGFLREARSIAALRHPNIVEVYDIGQDRGHLYMVMEYLEGRSLRALIQDNEEIDFPSMLRIMSQIAKALAFAHSEGVIHGDIKPDNIMVLTNGLAKLVDFGLAQQQNGWQNAQLVTGGTPAYMAPEKIGTAGPTVASDI